MVHGNSATGFADIVFGRNNYASAAVGITLGDSNTTLGQRSMSFGTNNMSYTQGSYANNMTIGMGCSSFGSIGNNMALGIATYVNGGDSQYGNLAVGYGNSALQTNYSFVGGYESRVETYSGTDASTNIGTESDIRPTFAFGYNVSAKGGATVFGFKNFGLGENSGHLGKAYNFTAAGSGVAGIINTNLTAGLTWYQKAPSGGEGGPFIVGSYNVGYHPGTFVAGISSYGMSPASFVACKGNVSFGYAQTVIGKYNKPEDALFTIGAGVDDNTRKNVFSVWSDSYNAKFFIGRGTDGANSSYWATDYPEFYVGDTLKLYGALSATGKLLSNSDISAVYNIYGSNIFTTGTLTSDYFVTTNGAATNNFTANNIITTSAKFYVQNVSGDTVALIHGRGDFYRGNTVNLNNAINSCITQIFMSPSNNKVQTATIGISSCLENYYYSVINIYNVNNSSTRPTRIEFTGNNNAYTWIRPKGSTNVPTDTTISIALGDIDAGTDFSYSTSSKHLTIMYCKYGNERLLFTTWE